jgi:hypothetical protein
VLDIIKDYVFHTYSEQTYKQQHRTNQNIVNYLIEKSYRHYHILGRFMFYYADDLDDIISVNNTEDIHKPIFQKVNMDCMFCNTCGNYVSKFTEDDFADDFGEPEPNTENDVCFISYYRMLCSCNKK